MNDLPFFMDKQDEYKRRLMFTQVRIKGIILDLDA